MKTKFIYLHGFNCDVDPNSEKVKLLKSLGEVEQLSYNSFDSYDDIMKSLCDKINENEDPVFIGTSLGGFYAAALANHFSRPAILINPAIEPYEIFNKLIGQKFSNYVNGKEDSLIQKTVESYKGKKIHNSGYYNKLVLLDAGDELLDSHKSKKYFKKLQSIVVMFEGGNHRFEHMKESLPLIEKYVNICEFISDY